MTVSSLPHWDLSNVYPGLDSPEFNRDFQSFFDEIEALTAVFDEHGIQVGQTPDADQAVALFETLLGQYDRLLNRQRTLNAYVASFVTTDSRNALAQAKLSELQAHASKLSLLGTRWTAWVGALDPEALLEQSALAQQHAFMIHKARRQAEHLMSPQEEALAAELDLTGGTAWSKLYGSFSSQLTVEFTLNGQHQTLPMSALRNLAYDPDRTTRQAAYRAELDAWQRAELPIAAALNSVKGQVNALTRRRGWGSALDAALFLNHIDRQTLDVMLQAATAAFPDFRRYLKAKAQALGLETLAWYDLFAPLGQGRTWTFDEAQRFIVEQFGAFSDKMQELAQRAFAQRWIDAEPRPGKRDGAFCMPLGGEESRILTNFKPSYGGVSTLAHELGHAYHNLNLAACQTQLQRTTPMTLAETASIFCETIVRRAALAQANPQEQMTILEASLQGACQVVVDITSRFRFEQAVFQRRRQRELSAAELCELMLEAQQQTYAEGLDPTALHPYMWAVKPHYYRAELSFYNFPYMFGLLFGLGLYAHYEQDPETFKATYDDLLASTGQADAATLAARFGIDLKDEAFWEASLDVVRSDIRRFEMLLSTP